MILLPIPAFYLVGRTMATAGKVVNCLVIVSVESNSCCCSQCNMQLISLFIISICYEMREREHGMLQENNILSEHFCNTLSEICNDFSNSESYYWHFMKNSIENSYKLLGE
jgi:hypothetical protein